MALLCLLASASSAQQPAQAGAATTLPSATSIPPGEPLTTPRQWAEAAAQNELTIIQSDGTLPLRYRVHTLDSKGDTTREVIETPQGAVARLIRRNGQLLTAAEDAAERQRLEDDLASPAAFLKHQQRDNKMRPDAMRLVRLMPRAMINTFASGQPQLQGATGPQIVLDFHPDPHFHAPNMLADVLTGFAGRAWIDVRSRRVIRIQAVVLHPVNFGWGILGRIYPGGTIELDQVDAGGSRWVYSHVATHLNVRVLVKTVPLNDTMTASDFRVLPEPVTFEQAIHMLLAMPIPLR